MTNKYLGTVDFVLDGKTYKLQFNYEAISKIITKFGKDMLNNVHTASPDELSFILAAGLWEDKITEEQIMKASPALIPAVKLVNSALAFAYFGPDGAPTSESEDSKKKPTSTK